MKLRIDTSRSYALALEGGGAKGAYQIGAWKALREAGVKIDAVAGTSVGALNGSLIVMDDLEKAENIWENIRYSQVMDVDDETMSRLLKGDVKLDELDNVAQQMFEVIKNRGFDVTPLRKWISQVVDEKTVRESPVELFIDTFSLSDGKLLELRAERFRRILQHEIKKLRVILKEDHGFDITVRILNESPPFVDGQISAAQVDPVSIYGISDRTDIHVRHTAAGKVIPGIAILFPADIHYAPTAINRNFSTGKRKNQCLEHPYRTESMNYNNNTIVKGQSVFT